MELAARSRKHSQSTSSSFEVVQVVGVDSRHRLRHADDVWEGDGMNEASKTMAPDVAAATFHGVRYQVADVSRSVAFYTTRLGFTLEHQQLPAFASVSLG